MRASGLRSTRSLRIRLGLICSLLLAAAGPIAAQESASERASFPVEQPARILLSRLQASWLDWLASINAGDSAAARTALERIQAYGAQVAMEYLPELALGASVRAVEAARTGQFDRAGWALEAAERLDPGRPETAFAAAAVARAGGDRLGALRHQVRGYVRTALDPVLRELAGHSVAAWMVQLLFLALFAWIGVQMAVKGGGLYRDLARGLARNLPEAAVHPLVWVIMVWPVLLPSGFVWLALYWTALLWSYGQAGERTLFVLAWLLIAAAPLLADLQQRRVARIFDPGLQVIEAAANGRLSGALLPETGLLETRLPDSVALDHALADLHRRLGQCDQARRIYARVLEREPANSAALADLGLCSYESGNYERAIQYFQLAAENGPPLAAVQFNLSQTYSELYRFTEAESALRAARALDSRLVNQWIASDTPRLMIPIDGGLRRTREISRALARRSPAGIWRTAGTRSIPLAVGAVIFALLTVALRQLPGFGGRSSSIEEPRWLPGAGDFWRRWLLVGTVEGEEGSWGRAFAALLALAAVLSIPWIGSLGLHLPWGLGPGPELGWVLFGLGLTVVLGARLLEQRRRSGG